MACSNYSLLRKPGWLKNPFSKPSAEASDSAATLPGRQEKTWYCYPAGEQKTWDCQEHPGADLAAASTDVVAPDSPSAQPTTLVASTVLPTPPPPVPELMPRPRPAPELEATPGPKVQETEVTPLDKNFRFITSHPDDYLAVQLIALESMEDIEAYVSRQQIEDPLFARIMTRGKIWYVLLLGIYPDRDTAHQAVFEWSATHDMEETPWIRKLGALVAAMNGALADG
jgi:septal ring-binding cell division protein DamX